MTIELAPPTDPRGDYGGRLVELQTDEARLERRYARLSRWRGWIIAALIFLAVLVEKEAALTKIVIIGVPALLVDLLIKRRVRVAGAMARTRWLTEHYERRLARVDERWGGTGETGARYVDAEHPAAVDLDLFGAGGVFERLATPCTRAGEDTLATWLQNPAGAAEVRERQAAVVELRERVELREELAYLAGHVAASAKFAHVARWGHGTPAFTSPVVRVLGALTVILTIIALIGGVFLDTGGVPVFIALAIHVAFALAVRRRASAVLGPVEERAYDLDSFARLLARLERERFTSPRLERLRTELDGAARRTARLHLLHRYAPFALLFACRPQVAMLLDSWRATSGAGFGRWLAAVGEIEALSALAAYSYECPDDRFPELLDDTAVFEAEGLGHPLLARERCIRNDVSLGTGVQILIVSGSNMAGKSTLLRAIGVNTVLALAGAPVRARKLRLGPLAVGATLRIQDSLLAGRSRFQAEVLRVRRLLEMSRGTPPLLFLLDEMFQGTNSADRRAGAAAVLRQLADAGAIGLVTTHDLALTEIAEQLSGRAVNVHFDDNFVDGELTFDYRMKPGVLQHTNGLALMRAVGIEV